jgi:hypothetical protein
MNCVRVPRAGRDWPVLPRFTTRHAWELGLKPTNAVISGLNTMSKGAVTQTSGMNAMLFDNT